MSIFRGVTRLKKILGDSSYRNVGRDFDIGVLGDVAQNGIHASL